MTGAVGNELQADGFTFVEQRRAQGRRGGLAIMVRNSIRILSHHGNEYAQQVQLGLPDGQRATITNVYLPPHTSLNRRNISNAAAQAAVEQIVTAAKATSITITCGDFNTRCGQRAPRVEHVQLDRRSMDGWECPRAPWFIQMCELAELHILNGKEGQQPAQFTFSGTQGHSVVDYVLSKDPDHVLTQDDHTLRHLTDHALQHLCLPVNVQPPPRTTPAATPDTTTYRWNVGTTTADTLAGIARWKAHSSTDEFRS